MNIPSVPKSGVEPSSIVPCRPTRKVDLRQRQQARLFALAPGPCVGSVSGACCAMHREVDRDPAERSPRRPHTGGTLDVYENFRWIPWHREIARLARLREGMPLENVGRVCLRNIAIEKAMYRSHEEGRWIDLF